MVDALTVGRAAPREEGGLFVSCSAQSPFFSGRGWVSRTGARTGTQPGERGRGGEGGAVGREADATPRVLAADDQRRAGAWGEGLTYLQDGKSKREGERRP